MPSNRAFSSPRTAEVSHWMRSRCSSSRVSEGSEDIDHLAALVPQPRADVDDTLPWPATSAQEAVSLREQQVRALIREMRTIQRVAGQCSIEGRQDSMALMAAAEAERAGRWADRLASLVDGGTTP